MEAYILLSYEDIETAKAIADAVSPDNPKTPQSYTVETECSGHEVSTRITGCHKLETLLSTIDDLLACVSTAEKALKALEEKSA